MIWAAVLATSAGCYRSSSAGLSVPERVLASPRVRAVALLMPVALLAALTAVQTFGAGSRWWSTRAPPGLAFAVVALLLRAPFLVVVVGAAGVAALLRAFG